MAVVILNNVKMEYNDGEVPPDLVKYIFVEPSAYSADEDGIPTVDVLTDTSVESVEVDTSNGDLLEINWGDQPKVRSVLWLESLVGYKGGSSEHHKSEDYRYVFDLDFDFTLGNPKLEPMRVVLSQCGYRVDLQIKSTSTSSWYSTTSYHGSPSAFKRIIKMGYYGNNEGKPKSTLI